MGFRQIGITIIFGVSIGLLQACSDGTSSSDSSSSNNKSNLLPLIAPDTIYFNKDITVTIDCNNSNGEICGDRYYRVLDGNATQPFIKFDPIARIELSAANYANLLTIVEYYVENTSGLKSEIKRQEYVFDTVRPNASYALDSGSSQIQQTVTISCSEIPLPGGIVSGCDKIFYEFVPQGSQPSGTYNQIDISSINSKQTQVTIFESGKLEYFVRDKAENDSALGETAEISITAPVNRPNPLPTFTASGSPNNFISLQWTYPSDTNLQRVVICRSEQSATPNQNCEGAIKVVDWDKTANSAQWNGMSFSDNSVPVLFSPLYYTAYLYDDVGVASSAVKTTATAGDMTPAAAVENLSHGASYESVGFTWSNPSANNGKNVNLVICRANSGFPSSNCSPIAKVDIRLGTYTDSASTTNLLVNGTTYYYSLFSVGENGVFSTAVQFSETPYDNIPPAAVTNAYTIASANALELRWTNPGDADLNTVKIFAKSDGAPIYSGLDQTFKITGLSNGTTYTFVLIAYDNNLNQSVAVEVSGVPNNDIVAPTVSSVTPGNGAVNVGAVDFESGISVTFSEAIKVATSVTPFILTDGAGNTVDGATTIIDNLLKFVPTDAQPALHTKYSASVTSNVTDLSNNPLSAPFSWTFTSVDGDYNGIYDQISDDPAPAGLLSTDNLPNIAMDAQGNAMAVWTGPGGAIFARHYDAINGWDTTQKKVSLDATAGNSPFVAMDKAGNALIVWLQAAPAVDKVYGISYSPTQGWGTAQSIQETSAEAFYLATALDGQGNAFVIWSDALNEIYMRRLPLFGQWNTAPASVPTITYSRTIPNIRNLSVVADNSGNAIAIWNDTLTTTITNENTVFIRRFSGSWDSTATPLDAETGVKEYYPVIAMDGLGNAIAAWRINQARTAVLRFDASNGSWGAIKTYNPGNANTLVNGVYPSVAMNAIGQAVIAWGQSGGIYLMDYSPATLNNGAERWGTPSSIFGVAVTTKSTLDDSGNALVVWDNESSKIYSNRFHIGDTPDFAVSKIIRNRIITSGNVLPNVASDRYGRALVVWSELLDIGAINVSDTCFAQRFE